MVSETFDIIDSSQWTKKWVLHMCVICMGFEIQNRSWNKARNETQ